MVQNTEMSELSKMRIAFWERVFCAAIPVSGQNVPRGRAEDAEEIADAALEIWDANWEADIV